MTNLQTADSQMLAETVPPRILPRVLRRFDLVTVYFAIIFGSYGAAQMAAQGWAGIPMMVLAAVTFLLPCALASYELGTLFPSEGGIYVWAHKAFGPSHGFIAGWLSWIPIFLLLPLDASIISPHIQYIFGVEWGLWTSVICQILFVWILFGLTALRLRISQTVVNGMFFVAMGTAVAALIAGLLHGHPVNPVTSDIFSLDLGKWGFLYSAAVLWLLGVEVPYNMSAEYSEHKRTGKTMLAWGTLALLVGYFMGIIGILWSTPLAHIDQTTGIVRAVASVSPFLGIVVAIGIVFAVFAQATSTMNAYSRLVFVGGVEKKLPGVMAKVSDKGRTPWPAMLVQAVGGTVVILIFATQTQLVVTYNLYLAALVAVWCASLFYIYFALIKARTKYSELYKERGDKVWRIPGGKFGLWAVCIWGIVFNALAIYYVFAKPWVSGISSHSWLLWLGITCVSITIIGIIVYILGNRRVGKERKAA
ncbi:MAG: APC family permease [Candidatus Pacebacteria bacterium]|nr:APC family permease [Candidatus Paceibacterota bacterium]MDD5357402.1 APC family permease [Candidatus Paceibacterota bacterium]